MLDENAQHEALTKASHVHVVEETAHHEVVIDGRHWGANLRHEGEVLADTSSGTVASSVEVTKGFIEQGILRGFTEPLLLPRL